MSFSSAELTRFVFWIFIVHGLAACALAPNIYINLKLRYGSHLRPSDFRVSLLNPPAILPPLCLSAYFSPSLKCLPSSKMKKVVTAALVRVSRRCWQKNDLKHTSILFLALKAFTWLSIPHAAPLKSTPVPASVSRVP